MFKHILVPTDGSELSNMAVRKAVNFAKELKAKITGVTVTAPPQIASTWAAPYLPTAEQHREAAKSLATANLSVLKEAAGEAGVECELVICGGEHPYEEILKTARDRKCDLIFLASHGRRGLSALLLGSETQKVITHSEIPVMVFR